MVSHIEKYIYCLLFISLQVCADETVDVPVVVTSSQTGSLIIEPGYSELSNYTKRKDLMTGVITLTPYREDSVALEWIIAPGSHFSNFEEAANYCLSLGDGWNRPLIRQIEIELEKEASERAPEINEALEALSDYGGFGTFPMTMVADAQLQYKKVIRREDPFGWVQFGGTVINERDRYLCVRPVVLRPIGKNKS
ncbi:hypothetical protein ACET69_18595 [Aeromonas veronii]